MEYQYKCRITAWDFFRLTMRQTYHSMAGMCNLVFTVAMILLTAKFWSQSGEVLQVLMLIGCLLFPVIQPEERDSICRGTGCGLQNSRGWCWCFREPEAAIC